MLLLSATEVLKIAMQLQCATQLRWRKFRTMMTKKRLEMMQGLIDLIGLKINEF
jgi:hypothetical protein